jgi:hypothetical protein
MHFPLSNDTSIAHCNNARYFETWDIFPQEPIFLGLSMENNSYLKIIMPFDSRAVGVWFSKRPGRLKENTLLPIERYFRTLLYKGTNTLEIKAMSTERPYFQVSLWNNSDLKTIMPFDSRVVGVYFSRRLSCHNVNTRLSPNDTSLSHHKLAKAQYFCKNWHGPRKYDIFRPLCGSISDQETIVPFYKSYITIWSSGRA